ncbi:MAG TPA: sugar phosphate nucleotidyltransferase [Candidatus Saccharimonadales bacterium]|nr:sugar phosphate nucleotidyltransferase [Candidatus Saccharimonadales bacterium]
MNSPERAIIMVAGFGTRRLPITKAIEKCMLLVNDRPVVDYVVEDCIKAGVREIDFVVGAQSDQLRTYYGSNAPLENYLRDRGETEILEQVLSISRQADFRYRPQPDGTYGTAVPAAIFAEEIGQTERVLFLSGDDLVYNPAGSETARLVESANAQGSSAGMLAARARPGENQRYGALAVTENPDGSLALKSIAEKPATQASQSRLINISKYLFDKALFGCAQEVFMSEPAPNGEHQVTDALDMYVERGLGSIAVVPIEGQFFDCGDKHGWLAANDQLISA